MPDDTSRIGPEDQRRISLRQRHEVRYWISKWGISEKTLEEAVAAVGDSAYKVQGWLERKGRI